MMHAFISIHEHKRYSFYNILLTHWGRVTHIYVIKLTSIVSDYGLSPGWRQAIIWNNAGILFIWTLGTNFSQWNLIRNSYIVIQENAFENVVWKMATILSRTQCVNISYHFRKYVQLQQHLKYILNYFKLNAVENHIFARTCRETETMAAVKPDPRVIILSTTGLRSGTKIEKSVINTWNTSWIHEISLAILNDVI